MISLRSAASTARVSARPGAPFRGSYLFPGIRGRPYPFGGTAGLLVADRREVELVVQVLDVAAQIHVRAQGVDRLDVDEWGPGGLQHYRLVERCPLGVDRAAQRGLLPQGRDLRVDGRIVEGSVVAVVERRDAVAVQQRVEPVERVRVVLVGVREPDLRLRLLVAD